MSRPADWFDLSREVLEELPEQEVTSLEEIRAEREIDFCDEDGVQDFYLPPGKPLRFE
jgi:hypothetical protein